MAAPGGLEQWQKDGFFQAAEEVQESADLMESIYRTWMHERNSGASSEEVNDLQRELKTALGTAKWQLEQFERAVNLSSDKYSLEEGTVARRRQFVVAMEDQISQVEKAINDYSIDNDRKGLNWVKLDDEERDDLVAFLSAPAQLSQETKRRENSHHSPSKQKSILIGVNDPRDMAAISKDRHRTEVSSREISNGQSEACLAEQLNGYSTNLSSGDDHWKIDIADGKDDDRKLSPNKVEASSQTTAFSGIMKTTESFTRIRWLRNSLWKAKSDEHLPLRYDMPSHLDWRVITLLSQKFNGLTERSRSCFSGWKENSRVSGRMGGLHIQSQQHSTQFGRSIRITLLLCHFSCTLLDNAHVSGCW
uniref:Syntaxin 6/10/61 N-terminal domain-containing protein n=1 Tax=Leersia perrieri TaxID=77586 RepID=A0A0D9X5R9_9ORYZ